MSQPPAYYGGETKQSAPPPDAGYYPTQAQQPPQQQLYPQPGTAYYYPGQPQPPAYGVPPGQSGYVLGQPQQQPAVVVVSGQPVQSYVGHIVFGVCSFCCCGIFGLVGLILGVVAHSQAASQPNSARTMGKLSIGFSVANIIVGIVILILMIMVFFTTLFQTLDEIKAMQNNSTLLSQCNFFVNGNCYSSRELARVASNCMRGRYFHAVDGYCYYNNY